MSTSPMGANKPIEVIGDPACRPEVGFGWARLVAHATMAEKAADRGISSRSLLPVLHMTFKVQRAYRDVSDGSMP